MRATALIITLTFLMALPGISFAQSASGRYATFNGQDTAKELPDGTTVVTSHYGQITFASKQSHPMDNVSSDCMGRFHMMADGTLISGGGTCTGTDADGNSASFWWRVEKANTSDCADLCGAWGYYNGTGKFKGIKGSGTWIRETLFPNGSSGSWKGAATLM